MRTILAIAAVLLAAGIPPAQAQPAQEPSPFAALGARYPDSALIERRRLAAADAAGDAAAVRAGLERLAGKGYAPSAATLDRLARHVPEAEMAALRARFDANRVARPAGRSVASIPSSFALIEGVAWDEGKRRMLATAVVGRALVHGDGARWEAVPGLDVGSLAGIAIDAPRRLLWVASSATERTPDKASAFRGLVALDLDTLRTVRRVPVPDEGSPSDIAVAAEGTVYASDPVRGTIYRLGAGDPAAAVALPGGTLLNPQGLVPAADGKRLYVADYVYGPMVVDLAARSAAPLPSDAATMLDGIDGLLPYGKGLIAIQNGTSPRRILYLALDAAGARITRAEVLESANPGWGEPTLGFLRGDELLYVDGQGERYGEAGAVTGEGPVAPTAIRALPLGGRGF